MDKIFGMHWHTTFVPDIPLLEIFIRGTIVYLAIFLLLGLLRRGTGGITMSDLLVLIIIADAAQNAMASTYDSLTDGMCLVIVIIGWSYALDWLGFHFPRIRRLTYPNPLLLIRGGHAVQPHLRRELISHDELLSQLRLQGICDISEVREAYLEGDGRISVVGKSQERHDPPDRAGE
ncbi:MAG: DUF421 domain-containing protein [Thermomicrobiales bacterium]